MFIFNFDAVYIFYFSRTSFRILKIFKETSFLIISLRFLLFPARFHFRLPCLEEFGENDISRPFETWLTSKRDVSTPPDPHLLLAKQNLGQILPDRSAAFFLFKSGF